MILGAFRHGQKGERLGIGAHAYLRPQRGHRFLQCCKARVRRSMSGQLQRQVSERGRHEADDALGAEARRLRQGDRRRVERECKRRKVKIAVRQHHAVGGNDERTLRCAPELHLDQVADACQRRLQRALHLRDDAEAQRILHATRRMGGQEGAAVEQRAQLGRRLDLTGAGRARAARARPAATGSRGILRRQRDRGAPRGGESRVRRRSPAPHGDRRALALISASRLSGPNVTGASPTRRNASPPGSVVPSLRPALADQRRRGWDSCGRSTTPIDRTAARLDARGD